VPDSAILPVDVLGVPLLYHLHAFRQFPSSQLKEDVDVIRHQGVRVDPEGKAALSLGQDREITIAVPVVPEENLPVVPTGDDVVKSADCINARLAGHLEPPSIVKP
jgi:hypothetical protein